MIKYLIIVFVVLIVGYMAFIIWSDYTTKRPSFKVISNFGKIQVRQYREMNIAVVKLSAKDSLSSGFRVLANYIFSNNIPMTSPVLEYTTDRRLAFILPSGNEKYANVKPKNKSIIIEKIKPKRYIAIKFSGGWQLKNYKLQESKLLAFIKSKKIIVVGEPIFAYYNSPWVLPFLRHNEVLLELEKE